MAKIFEKPITDVTFTSYAGVPVTLLRAPTGKWIADLNGHRSIGPLGWTALCQNVEFCMSPANIRRTLTTQAEG